jgi:archaellum component FlaC
MYALPMIKKRMNQIEKRIEKIKIDLSGIDEMRPGSLTSQYKDPEKTNGPYYQISYTHEMNSCTNYVKKSKVNEVRQQIKNYKRFKALTTEWVSLGIEHSQLKMKLK